MAIHCAKLQKQCLLAFATINNMRVRWEMPDDVKQAIAQNDLLIEYNARPPYQRNDYIGWINRAKRAVTRQKRIDQMIEELKAGNVYMKMAWSGKANR